MLRNLAIASLLLAQPAACAQDVPPPLPDLAVESYTLPNGLKVALHRDPAVPRVTVCVANHVGSKNEKAGRTGFAHFFEHLLFRGTKNVPNYDILLQETGRPVERLHLGGPDGLLRDRPRPCSSTGSTSRPNGWRSCRRRSTGRSSTPKPRGRQERAAASLSTTSPTSASEEAIPRQRLPEGAPLLVVGDRLDEGPDAAHHRRPPAVLRRVLPPRQCHARPRGRLRPRPREGRHRQVLRAGSPPASRSSRSSPRPPLAASKAIKLTDRPACPGSRGRGRPSPTTTPTRRPCTSWPRSSATARPLARRGARQGGPRGQRGRRHQRHQGGVRLLHHRCDRRRGEDGSRRSRATLTLRWRTSPRIQRRRPS